jgi:hypothetical protein
MALDVNDLAMLKGLDTKEGLSPYEQVKLDYMSAKRPSNVAVTSIVFGGAALVGVAASMIYGGMYANAKSKEAKEAAIASEKVANAQYQSVLQLIAQGNANTKDNIDRLLLGLQRETDARAAGDTNISQTITDTISGQQSAAQSSQVSQTSAIDTSVQQIMTQTLSDAITGKSSLNPTPVTIYSAPAPCGCPGCGCNG